MEELESKNAKQEGIEENSVQHENKGQEPQMSEQELKAFWNAKMSQAKKHLKKLSKNELIRTVIQMSVRAYEQDAYIQNIYSQLKENSSEDSSSPANQF